MTAATVHQLTPHPDERRVRLTVTGLAREVRTGMGLLCVNYGHDEDAHTILVDTKATGVVLENLPMVRTWSHRDVIAGDCTTLMRDRDGLWRGRSSNGETMTLTDAQVSAAVDCPGGYDVLRYQAGDA